MNAPDKLSTSADPQPWAADQIAAVTRWAAIFEHFTDDELDFAGISPADESTQTPQNVES